MKITVHFYTFAIVLVFANARYIVQQDCKNNSTNNGTTIETPKSFSEKENVTSVVHHIRRQKREVTPNLPFDLFTMHHPCYLDVPKVDMYRSHNLAKYRKYHWLEPHCITIYNNRFAHEGHYRIYNLYRMEGFTFGMYYERLKRFETEDYMFDYHNVVVE